MTPLPTPGTTTRRDDIDTHAIYFIYFSISRYRLFYVLNNWKWPNPGAPGSRDLRQAPGSAIRLCRPYNPQALAPPAGPVPLNLPQWNPAFFPRDAWHLMPIVTPAYPCMNSSYNVNLATRDIMRAEFARGEGVVKGVLDRSKASTKRKKEARLAEAAAEAAADDGGSKRRRGRRRRCRRRRR